MVWVYIGSDHVLHKLFHEEFLLEEEFVVVLELDVNFFFGCIHRFSSALHRTALVIETVRRHYS